MHVLNHVSFSPLMRSVGRRLIAPFYHAVSDQPLPHIRHLYAHKSIRAFEADLDFLLKHYEPIDFHQLGALQPKKNKPRMLLSFDDGLTEFWDPIAPMLLRKGVPAICFLNSAFIDNRALFFRYKASLIIDAFENQHLERTARVYLLGKGYTHISSLKTWLLSLRYHEQSLLDELAAVLGIDFSQFLARQQPYLTTIQIESLIQKGFHFGAHSIDHPEYRWLSLEEQLRQTVGSIEYISNRFGLGYRLFSFPFTDYGVEKKFFDFMLNDKKAAEYTFGCAGLKTDVHPNHIQRIPMENGSETAEQTLKRTFLYFWLKLPLGKNRIQRQ
ncbi:MAG: polysaccharide deacetylase family protein [Saprospiraceae bacterium]|nr:polysaccharide deacetylase family protein [Saprospiraceae bacterium]